MIEIFDFFNDTLNYLMVFIRNALLIFLALLSLRLSLKLIRYTRDITHKLKRIDRLKQGIVTLEDIHELTPREFESWCKDFLSKEGYTNIIISPKGPDGGKDMECSKGTIKYYVECKRYKQDASSKFKVDSSICKKLLGIMAANSIENGIIMTTGIITNDAIAFIKSLPKPYNLEAYDGNDLIKEYTERSFFETANSN